MSRELALEGYIVAATALPAGTAWRGAAFSSFAGLLLMGGCAFFWPVDRRRCKQRPSNDTATRWFSFMRFAAATKPRGQQAALPWPNHLIHAYNPRLTDSGKSGQIR